MMMDEVNFNSTFLPATGMYGGAVLPTTREMNGIQVPATREMHAAEDEGTLTELMETGGITDSIYRGFFVAAFTWAVYAVGKTITDTVSQAGSPGYRFSSTLANALKLTDASPVPMLASTIAGFVVKREVFPNL